MTSSTFWYLRRPAHAKPRRSVVLTLRVFWIIIDSQLIVLSCFRAVYGKGELEDIYNWIQLASGYRLTELKSKRDQCLETLQDYLLLFDTEFGDVLTIAQQVNNMITFSEIIYF